MKGQLKQADRIRSANTLVFEEDGTTWLRNSATNERQQVEPAPGARNYPFLTTRKPKARTS